MGGDDEPSWHLGKNKHVKVRQFKGQTYIDIRNDKWFLIIDVNILLVLLNVRLDLSELRKCERNTLKLEYKTGEKLSI